MKRQAKDEDMIKHKDNDNFLRYCWELLGENLQCSVWAPLPRNEGKMLQKKRKSLAKSALISAIA